MKTLTTIILALLLAACGGGEATQQDKDEADAALPVMTAQPVDRAASGVQ